MKIDEPKARELFETYSNYVFSTALLLTGTESLADDITQDSFLRIFHYYHTYDDSKPIKPWIYKIVLNTTRTVLKKQSKQRTVRLDFEILSDANDLITGVIEDEHKRALMAAMNQVSLKSREVIILRFFEEMNLAEIADTLSIPLGTCKSRLNTAINQIRKYLPQDITVQYQGGEGFEKS